MTFRLASNLKTKQALQTMAVSCPMTLGAQLGRAQVEDPVVNSSVEIIFSLRCGRHGQIRLPKVLLRTQRRSHLSLHSKGRWMGSYSAASPLPGEIAMPRYAGPATLEERRWLNRCSCSMQVDVISRRPWSFLCFFRRLRTRRYSSPPRPNSSPLGNLGARPGSIPSVRSFTAPHPWQQLQALVPDEIAFCYPSFSLQTMTSKGGGTAADGRVHVKSGRRPLAVRLRELLLLLLLVSTAAVMMARWNSYAAVAVSLIAGAASQVLDLSTVDWTVWPTEYLASKGLMLTHT